MVGGRRARKEGFQASASCREEPPSADGCCHFSSYRRVCGSGKAQFPGSIHCRLIRDWMWCWGLAIAQAKAETLHCKQELRSDLPLAPVPGTNARPREPSELPAPEPARLGAGDTRTWAWAEPCPSSGSGSSGAPVLWVNTAAKGGF